MKRQERCTHTVRSKRRPARGNCHGPEGTAPPLLERSRRVVYVGRLEAYKHVDVMLRAMAQLGDRFPDCEILVIGKGAARPSLEALAQELGIAERTRFTGFVSDEERDALVGEARVCVCPSVKEGWGITVIEANALGVPVVATDAPGLRDAVRHDETGLLVADAAPEVFSERLASAVERLLTDEALLTRLSSQALAWSRRFDWDSSAQRMAEVIEETRRRLR